MSELAAKFKTIGKPLETYLTEPVPEAFELPTSDWTENSYCPIISKKFKWF